MESFILALQLTFSPLAILMVVSGTMIGTILGALPGLGSIVGITICLPFTYTMGSVPAIALLLGVYAGSIYGGCISSVLINTPGTPQSAATALEGYPMALDGKAGEAIGWATMASVIGGLFSCLVLLIAAPQLAKAASKFGAVEMFALIFLGISSISTLASGSKIKGIFSGIVGLALAIVGQDPITGEMRFTFDTFALMSGIDLIPLVVGAFAISEILTRVDAISRLQKVNPIKCSRMILPGIKSFKGRWWQTIKSSAIGAGIGILPGAGATAAAFISYGEAQRSSPNKASFGKGEPDGIIAAEAANNAVTGGALVPSFALGLPGDAVTAIMLATLILHGIVPGARLMQESPTTVYAAILTLSLANLLLIPCGILVMRAFSGLLRMPEQLFLPSICLLCLLGAYAARMNTVDFYMTFLAGFMGITFRYFGIPIAPMVIGLVLGFQFEFTFRQSIILTDGDMSRMFTEHPIAAGLFALTIFIQVSPYLKQKLFARKEPNTSGAALLHSDFNINAANATTTSRRIKS